MNKTAIVQPPPRGSNTSVAPSPPNGFSPWKLIPEERWYLLAIVGFFSQGVLMTVGDAIHEYAPLVDPTAFSSTIIFIPFFLYLYSRINDRKPLNLLPFMVLYLLLIIYMMYTLIAHPENAEAMFDESWDGNIFPVLFSPLSAVVAFLIVTAAPRPELLLHGLKYAAYLTFAGNIVRLGQATVQGSWVTANSMGQEIEVSYNLGFGYSVLLSVLVFLYFAFAGQRVVLHVTGAIAGMVMIFTDGSRAPLGIAIAGLIILMIYFYRRLFLSTPARFAIFVLLTAGMIAVLTNLNRLLLSIQSLMKSMGVESRTFDKLMSGTFDDDRARNILGQMSDELIASGGAFGHGLFGDRYDIRSRFRWGYPHNIVDEMLITYGTVGGWLLIVSALIFVIFAIVKSRGTLYCDLIVLMIPLTFQLWVSLSYLMSDWFWVLMGACWAGIHNSRAQNRLRPHETKW